MGRLTSLLGDRVYLDANIVVYAVEGFAPHAKAIKALLRAVDDGELTVATSDLTLAEVLIKPFRDANAALEAAYRQFLAPSSVLQVAPVSRSVLIDAARLRSATGLKLPDAIHAATASSLGCDSLLTNDHSFGTLGTPRVVLLPDVDAI